MNYKLLIAGLCISSFLFLNCQNKAETKGIGISSSGNLAQAKEPKKPILDSMKTVQKAKEALVFCKEKKFNDDYCILIDMSLHSGVKRLMIWDFKLNKIMESYLVGHGAGENAWSLDQSKDNPKFSNVNDSHLSSLGKYKLGERGYSSWGINVKYLMHGLEESNNNALKRVIVFHSWDKMSDDEVFPAGSPEGWGCPTISNNAMRAIDPRLQRSKKPVLMWIYQ